MILVDKAVGSFELQSLIQRQGIRCEKAALDAADACFEGMGPEGQVLIGVERKKVQEALDCIDTGRLGGFQLPKMRRMYRFRFVLIEGTWRPNVKTGFLERMIVKPDGKVWWTDELGGGGKAMYHKLRRYLFSVTMAGAHVLYTQDILHTAFDITELYHWFQKPWHKHESMNQMYSGKAWDTQVKQSEELVMIPTIDRRPSLVRQWAADINGVGVKLSADAERVFKTPLALATADETEWMDVPGIGMKMAADIVRQIHGGKR